MNNDMQKDVIGFLEQNKMFLKVEDIDGKKKITFKSFNFSRATETVDNIVNVKILNNVISLPDNLKDGKYFFFSDEGVIYICNVKNNKIDGNVKEYNKAGGLLFEGEYKNNKKRNGKGKEYYDGKVIFEGVYQDGERKEGKEHGFFGAPIFEGEYKNNKRNGKGKECAANGKLLFEGEYINNCRNGKGKEYDYRTGQLLFEGEYANNKRHGECKEYDENGKVIFEGKYKDGLRWNGKGKIYIQTKDGCIEKKCDYNEGKKDGYEVTYYVGKSVIIRKYQNGKAMEESLYVNGEECSKIKLRKDIYAHTDSTKTNYEDTNVVVYNLVEKTLSLTTRKIRDKFGEKTQLLTKDDLDHEPNENIKIAEGTDKLELFINFHGADNPETHPICLHDIRPISNKVSNAIVGSKGQIKTLTIKLVNCYGRTYDLQGNDLKAEILKDIYTKALEQAKKEKKELDLSTLPTILISGATIDSLVVTYESVNNTGKKGCKRLAKKEYFSFGKQEWKKVAEIIEKHNKNNENTINDKNGKMDKELNDKLVSLFTGIDKKDYRQLKGYYNHRDNNIDNKETTKMENNKGNNI